jgi:hypothetical protein
MYNVVHGVSHQFYIQVRYPVSSAISDVAHNIDTWSTILVNHEGFSKKPA